jgi:hypothetical protein
MMDRVSTHARLLKLISDGEWHGEEDLRKITLYPGEWMTELRHEVAVDEGGAPVVRLSIPDLPSCP